MSKSAASVSTRTSAQRHAGRSAIGLTNISPRTLTRAEGAALLRLSLSGFDKWRRRKGVVGIGGRAIFWASDIVGACADDYVEAGREAARRA